MTDKKTEALKLALKKAFDLGERYWSWADSEYSSHWKKADAAKEEFNQLVEDTIREALAEQPDPSAYWHNEFLKHNTTSEKPAQDQGQSCYCPECERLSKELDVITLKDLERALHIVQEEMRTRKATPIVTTKEN